VWVLTKGRKQKGKRVRKVLTKESKIKSSFHKRGYNPAEESEETC